MIDNDEPESKSSDSCVNPSAVLNEHRKKLALAPQMVHSPLVRRTRSF